jgi:hypothetical protein
MIKKLIIACLSLIIIPKVALAATVNITDDSLEESLSKIIKIINEENKDDEDYSPITFSIDKTAHKITFMEGDNNLGFDYNISDDNVTFSEIVKYYKGMTHEEYTYNSDNIFSYMGLMYIAIADHYEINFEDSLLYFSLTFLQNSLENVESSESCPSVIDDESLADGATMELSDGMIKKSEFGNYAIVCAKETVDVNRDKIFNDDNGINSYSIYFTDDANEMPNVISNENEYNVKYVFTVDRNANFSEITKLVEEFNKNNNNNANKDNDDENNTNISKDEEPTTSKVEDNNPKTGFSYHLVSLILVFIIGLISYLKLTKKDLFKRV